jgi:hypothetical protein
MIETKNFGGRKDWHKRPVEMPFAENQKQPSTSIEILEMNQTLIEDPNSPPLNSSNITIIFMEKK